MNGWREYQAYLKTDHWSQLRQKAFALYGRKRSKCGSEDRLQVHHKQYRWNHYATQVEDLQVLCEPCHAAVHGKTLKVLTPEELERRKIRFLQSKFKGRKKPKWVKRLERRANHRKMLAFKKEVRFQKAVAGTLFVR